MKPTTTAAPADPVLLLLALGWLTIEAAAVLIIAALALLLTVAGWRPSPPSPRPAAPEPLPVVLTPALLPPAPAEPLEGLTVRELRILARAAGLPQLARSGRRADLIEALA